MSRVWEDEDVLGTDSGDDCWAVGVHSLPLNYTLKNAEVVNLIYYVYFITTKVLHHKPLS